MDAAVVLTGTAAAPAAGLGSSPSSPIQMSRGATAQSCEKVGKRNAGKSDEASRAIADDDENKLDKDVEVLTAAGDNSNERSGNDSVGAASSAKSSTQRDLKTAMTSVTRVASPATHHSSPQPSTQVPPAPPLSSSTSDNTEATGTGRHLTAGGESAVPSAGWTSSTSGQVQSGQLLQQQQHRHQHQSRKRRSSGDSYEGVSVKSNHSGEHIGSTMTSAGAGATGVSNEPMKDEDDDNEEDDDDDVKLQSSGIDPDRLKAFNLFVRLFVDENLDRIVPISKQPKDKVQAILEACDRQFPEFHDRARKRIRTYLKSCRRMRRCKEGNGLEQLRPTPPHLTSAIAETILAQACENESNNAKRMRMGLEPLPAIATVRPTSPIPPGSLQQPAPVASRSAGESPSNLYPVPDQPSSRMVTPPSRPPSSSSGVPLAAMGSVVAAATASAVAAGGTFPKQERISPATAAVAMVTRMAPDDVALALTSSSSSVTGRHQQQAHVHQSPQLMALTTPGAGYDVQTAAAMLFGVPQSLPQHNLNGSISGFVNAVNHRSVLGNTVTLGSGLNMLGTTSTSSIGARTAHLQTPSANQVQNGPTDLSVKKSSPATQAQHASVASAAGSIPLASVVASCGAGNGGGAAGGNGIPRNQLTSAEIDTVKQLIAGYRESAAFLYRSADELEVLLQHN